MKRLLLFVSSFSVLLLSFSALLPAPKASAESFYRDECSNQYLRQWDLPKMLKEHMPEYENGKSAIYMYKSSGSDQTRNNYYAMVGTTTATKFTMGFEESTLKAAIYVSGGTYRVFTTIYDEPKGEAYGFDTHWTGTTHNTNNVGYDENAWFRVASPPSSPNSTTKTYSPDMSNTSCFVTFMGNVDYAPSWHARDFATLPNNLEYNSSDDNKSGCSALDLGCWIAYFFKPNSTDIQSSFNSIKTTWNTKLGFISTATEKIGNLFAIFANPPTTCTTSSCSYTFGNLFGSPMHLNVAQLAQTAPTLWSYVTMIVRGLVVVALCFAIRRKTLNLMEDRA